MEHKNSKVPMTVLSCFLIAFILQGVLKLCGVFVFEKALDWDIFKIIDNTLWLQIIYYGLIMVTTMYCLSFSLTTKCYSNKWYHYVIISLFGFGATTLRLLVSLTNQIQIVLDVLVYIVIPIIINLTTNKEDKAIKNDIIGFIITFALQILMYFAYLGLGYWSALLNSMLPINPMWASPSCNFLVRLEMYIALFTFMISSNMLVKHLKGDSMFLPIDIGSKKAKLEEKKSKLLKEVEKIDVELKKLENEDNK